MAYSQAILDFYEKQVLKENSLFNKYKDPARIREFSKPWNQLSPDERGAVRRLYDTFRKILPTLNRIESQNLIRVTEAAEILGIPETKSSTGAVSGGLRARIHAGADTGFAASVLKPKFNLKRLDIGEGKPTWFMKNPKKIPGGVKLLQDYYLRRGAKYGITPDVVKRVKNLHRNPAIVELLKIGNLDSGEALAAMQKKWGWTPSEASTVAFRLAQSYNGKKFINVDFALPKDIATARAIFNSIEEAPFHNIFHSRGYQIAMDSITENLGQKYFEKGTMDSFKRQIRKILEKEKIPIYDSKLPKANRYGFNLNEIVGTTPATRTGAHPYSQFVNLMEGKFNQGQYANYVRRFGDYQLDLQAALAKKGGDPSSVIGKYDAYAKDFRELHGLKKTDLPTLSLKDPSKIYSPERLASLKAQGLGLPEHFKKYKYSIDVGEAPTIKEVKQIPDTIKRMRIVDPLGKIKGPDLFKIFKKGTPADQFTIANAVRCISKADGGRIGYALGSATIECVNTKLNTQPLESSQRIVAGIEEGATGVLGKVRNAARGFLGALGRFGPAAGKFGAIMAAGAVAKPAFDMVRQFVNDDPSTYLTDPEQMERMLLSTIEAQERKKPRSEILDWGIGAAGVGATAAAVPGTGALWKARRLPFKREATLLRKGIDKAAYGMPRAALGPAMKLISGMYTPAGLLAAEPLRIAQMRRQGEDWGEIAQDPTLWMGPAFAPGMTRLATAGMKSSPLLAKALRLGMSPGALRMMGRVGMPGLALSLGLTGYDKYKDWKNKRGWFAKD